MEIRKETKAEHKEVENVLREAFWDIYRPGCNEHLILHNYRTNPDYVGELSNVIVLDDKIIGQVMFSKAILKNIKTGEKLNIGTFGPVSILPEFQKKGYGEYLINYTLKEAEKIGYKYIVIFGNYNYYKKFGFEIASTHGILIEGQK